MFREIICYLGEKKKMFTSQCFILQYHGILDLYTSIINARQLLVRRHQLYVTSFQDLKTNFWNRGTLVDSTHHWDFILFFKGILLTMKQFMKQSDLTQFRSSLFQVKLFPAKIEGKPLACSDQSRVQELNQFLLADRSIGWKKETQVTEIQNEAF